MKLHENKMKVMLPLAARWLGVSLVALAVLAMSGLVAPLIALAVLANGQVVLIDPKPPAVWLASAD